MSRASRRSIGGERNTRSDMNDSLLDAPSSLARATSLQPRRAAAPAFWALTVVATACTPAPDDGAESTQSASTDAALDAGEDTLADGCWEFAGEIEHVEEGLDIYPFEKLACSELPEPCNDVYLSFIGVLSCEPGEYELGPGSLANRAEIEEAARCVLAGLRDGVPAVYDIEMFSAPRSLSARYTVLDAGVVTHVVEDFDRATELFLGSREAAWFDACLAAPDLEGLLPCLWPPVSEENETCGGVLRSPVDRSACIGETPMCP
jgi:hypothetical protein